MRPKVYLVSQTLVFLVGIGAVWAVALWVEKGTFILRLGLGLGITVVFIIAYILTTAKAWVDLFLE